MAKVMLVEDDNNLREIYEARLLAEGYEIVSAKDGEEALALAVKEKPDLIISDVMMPKISGFDMLDILRSTPETKSTKVVMMTALSQVDDKNRAEKLGADRYLVKSQVTLEDVARVTREVLEGTPAAAAASKPATIVSEPTGGGASAIVTPSPTEPSTTPTPAPTPPSVVTPSPTPVVATPTPVPAAGQDLATATPVPTPSPTEPSTTPTPAPMPTPTPTPAPADDLVATATSAAAEISKTPDTSTSATSETPTGTDLPPAIAKQIQVMDATEQAAQKKEDEKIIPVTTIAPTSPDAGSSLLTSKEQEKADAPVPGGPDRTQEDRDDVPVAHKKVIQPIGDPTKKPDLNELLAKEEANAPTTNPSADSVVTPAGQITTSPDAQVGGNPTGTASSVIKPSDPNAVAL